MLLLDLLVVASIVATVVTVVVVPRGRVEARQGLPPAAALAVVAGATYVNQLFVVIHIRAVHASDPGFVARWLPLGWFELPRWAWLDTLAASWPAPELLAPSILHVPALLELPFVLLAYLSIGTLLGPEVVGGLTRPARLWGASVSFSVAFALIEWHYRNPWTTTDLGLRAVAAVVTPWLIQRFVGVGPRAAAPSGALSLVFAALGAASLGTLVLVVYDTALLYNLARVPGHVVTAAVALVGFAVASRGLRLRAATPGASVAWVGRLSASGVVVFFMPALAIRYDLTFGTRAVAGVAALAVAGLTLVLARPGWAVVVRTLPVAMLALLGAVGAVTAARRWLPDYYEASLLVAVGAFALLLLVGCAAVDRLSRVTS